MGSEMGWDLRWGGDITAARAPCPRSMDGGAYKRMRMSQDAMMRKEKFRRHDEEESFWQLMEMASYEPVINVSFSTIQAMCLSRDIDVVVDKKPSIPGFKKFINMYYKPFLAHCIRSFFVCGFAAVRFRRLASGDIVPECLPLGSFRWTVVANSMRRENESTTKQITKAEENALRIENSGSYNGQTDFAYTQGKDYLPKFTPRESDESKLLRYRIMVLTGNIKENEIYVYEFVQPTFNVSRNSRFYATVSSPMAGLIHEYRDLREARARRSMADAWNTRAHVVCSLKDSKIPTDQPRENFLATQLTLPAVRAEHNLFLASLAEEEGMQARKITEQIEEEFLENSGNHPPLLHILPKNYDSQMLGQLNPVEDIEQLYNQWTNSVFQLFKIPPKMMIGKSHGLQKEAGMNQRIFSAEMQQLCMHLRVLAANVYSIIYGEEDPHKVNFVIQPAPKIDVESIEDLKMLFEIGSIKPSTAAKLSDTLINADKDILASVNGNMGGMVGVPGEMGALKDRNESKEDRDAGKVTKTELQYQAPKKATPAKFAPPPKVPAGGKKK